MCGDEKKMWKKDVENENYECMIMTLNENEITEYIKIVIVIHEKTYTHTQNMVNQYYRI